MHMLVTLGMRLRLLRTLRGLEIGALAERAQVSRNAVSLLELGRMGAKQDTLERYAAALEVPVSALLDDASFIRQLSKEADIDAVPAPEDPPGMDRVRALLEQLGPERAGFVLGMVENLAGAMLVKP